MRVIRWKNAVTGVESLNITATGIYFPVGKTDSSFIARYSMASAGQTASVERVSSPNGSRVGSPAINVSGTTEVVVNERRGLSTGIIVTAISGTLISVLDDNTPITNFPDAGLGRFPAKEDADAYVYGSTVPQGIPAIINGVPYSWNGTGWGNATAIATASTAGAVKPGPGNRVLADGQIVTKYPTHVGDFVDANIWDGVIAFPGKYVTSAGTFGTLASYGVSSKIPVVPGNYYMCRTASTGTLGGAYYDASDNFIQQLNRYAGGTNSSANICVTRAPANAAYIYLTIGSSPAYLVAGVFPVALGRMTQKATTKIRGYGTSITKGVQGTLTRGYITLLASKLNASLVNMGGDGTCFATGYGNGCISDTLLATAVPCNPMPELLIIEGPVNDFKNNVPLGTATDSTNATFLGALNVMAAYIATNFPTTKVAWVADPYYLNAGTANSLGLKMIDYVNPFKQKALDMGFVYVDCFNQLSFLYSDTYNNIWTYDGIHPGDMGCDAMANLVLQAIGE